jgi:hypothetical protein
VRLPGEPRLSEPCVHYTELVRIANLSFGLVNDLIMIELVVIVVVVVIEGR